MVDMKDLEIKYLKEALRLISVELTRSGFSEYNPLHSEMIELGSWGFGLIEILESDEWQPS